ncbi:tetratricopeptide repeat protein [Amycolatopsis sp. NPDC051045]|uniref:tetratricopeptide repeat protein n=1 Tax=Amycolatopsis sp. NPDC051045 TaxID=3156922 RepID=UPI003432FFE3
MTSPSPVPEIPESPREAERISSITGVDRGRIPAQRRDLELNGDISGVVATGYRPHIEQHSHVHRHQPVEHWSMDQIQPSASAVFNVPHLTEMFVGRSEDLARLHSEMTSTRLGSVVVTALHGLSGIGKSTLAAHYAQIHRNERSLVWWVAAETSAAIESSLADLAIALLPALVQAPLEQQAELARQWLATHEDWLLILDNLLQPADAASILARLPRGQILITSRRADGWHAIAAPVDLDVLSRDDAVTLVTNIMRSRNPGSNVEGAAELCEALGCLPLAIEQASAYMAETSTSPVEYLDLLTRYPAAMYGETAEGGDAQRTMARIWRLTLDQLADTPLAGRILRMLAWYSPEEIPVTLLSELAEDPFLRRAIGRLNAYSLIKHEQGMISVHRLVQAVTRTSDAEDPHRGPEQVSRGRKDAARALAHHLKPLDYLLPANWSSFRAVLLHVRAFASYSDASSDTHDDIMLLRSVGVFLKEHGQIFEALNYLRRCHASSENLLGASHPESLSSCNQLAGAYRLAGDPEKAIQLHEAVLACRVDAFGIDHPDTLRSRHNLANAYLETEYPKRAVPLFEAVAADFVRMLGDDHPDTLNSRHSLANAYLEVDDLVRAIPLHEAVLADRVRVLGDDHPDTLSSRSSLAGAYWDGGDFGRAIPLLEAVVTDYLRVFGADHHRTLRSRSYLANAYSDAGGVEQAISLYEAVTSDYLRAFGAKHTDTLASRHNLAYAYLDADQPRRAVPLFEAVAADYVRLLGADHPDTLNCRHNLASAYLETEGSERAVPLYESVLADAERILGRRDPITKRIRASLRHVLNERQ